VKNENNARPVGQVCFQKSGPALLALCIAAVAAVPAAAQLARKPSYYQQQNQPQSQPPAQRPAVPSSLPALRGQADFDRLPARARL